MYKRKEGGEANTFDDFVVKKNVSSDENEMLSQTITELELKKALSSTLKKERPQEETV